MYIDYNGHIALWLTIMEGQQSLTLCWCSFWWWCWERFTFTFAYKGSQYSVYDNVKPVTTHITHDTRPTILTLCWLSFWEWGREGIAIWLAYNGSQKFLHDWLQSIGSVISQNVWPEIVDVLLTFIFRMWQGGYCDLFCLSRRSKIALGLTATYQRCDFPGCMIKSHWRSVDLHFQDEVGSVSL